MTPRLFPNAGRKEADVKVIYNESDRTYTVEGLPAVTAHRLIWGGKDGGEVRDAENDLRNALVDAEDKQMPEETYQELFA
jgi:hypothetical protein